MSSTLCALTYRLYIRQTLIFKVFSPPPVCDSENKNSCYLKYLLLCSKTGRIFFENYLTEPILFKAEFENYRTVFREGRDTFSHVKLYFTKEKQKEMTEIKIAERRKEKLGWRQVHGLRMVFIFYIKKVGQSKKSRDAFRIFESQWDGGGEFFFQLEKVRNKPPQLPHTQNFSKPLPTQSPVHRHNLILFFSPELLAF